MGDRPLLDRDRGSAAVEFFLVLPMVILVLVAGMHLVTAVAVRTEMVAAARDGARVAATTPDPAHAVEAVRLALPPSMRDRARISVTRPSLVGQPAQVVIQLRHYFGSPFPEGVGIDLSASASMLVER